jgi:hypothetical protein
MMVLSEIAEMNVQKWTDISRSALEYDRQSSELDFSDLFQSERGKRWQPDVRLGRKSVMKV